MLQKREAFAGASTTDLSPGWHIHEVVSVSFATADQSVFLKLIGEIGIDDTSLDDHYYWNVFMSNSANAQRPSKREE